RHRRHRAGRVATDWAGRGTRQHRDIIRIRDRLSGDAGVADYPARAGAAVQGARDLDRRAGRGDRIALPDVRPAAGYLDQTGYLASDRARHLLFLWREAQPDREPAGRSSILRK